MDGFKITVEDKPEPTWRDTIVSQLEAYNGTKVERPTVEPLAIALKHTRAWRQPAASAAFRLLFSTVNSRIWRSASSQSMIAAA